jgi:type I restriction enzyme S subunit
MTLPQGWVRAKLNELVGLNGIFCDGDWVESKDQDPNGKIRLIQLADIGDGYFIDKSNRFLTMEKAAELHCTFLEKGDLLIARMPSPLGRVSIFPLDGDEKFVTVVDVAIYRLGHDLVSDKYCCYMINALPTRNAIAKQQSGTTRKRIARTKLEEIQIPISPLAEQHRIVAKIDVLFSELDKGVEVLHIVRQQLRTYRQAVLQWAFEGREWELVPLSRVTSFVTSGSRGWAQYYSNEGAKFIRIGNLTREGIKLVLNDVQCVSLPNDAEGLRSLLRHNDMLISITADLGSIGIVPADLGEAYINQHIALTRFNNPSLVEFYAWYLKSDKGRKNLLKNRRGGTKVGLGLDDVRDSLVPIVSEEIANDVVNAIESRLSVCDKLEQIVNENLTKAQALRQSILKMAFMGKLVPQNPNDEPAEKLLERIKSAKATVATQTATTRRKKK